MSKQLSSEIIQKKLYILLSDLIFEYKNFATYSINLLNFISNVLQTKFNYEIPQLSSQNKEFYSLFE